jgi:acetyl esterase/lipase
MLMKTTASHAFGRSETPQWDLRTDLTIKLIRSLMTAPRPTAISKTQRVTLRDPGIKGKMWVSKVELPMPAEADVTDLLKKAIDDLGSGNVAMADLKPVEAEWNGYRMNASAKSPRPPMSEAKHYESLMKDTRSDLTVLYIHGGALYLLDPASYRPMCSQLARKTGGRCFSVRYRLAPQHPFPAALLDVFVAYLSLLHPPPGALHDPVPAEKIVFSGDSAGGNLSLALLQLLLQINRSAKEGDKIRFHDKEVSLPLPVPAGLALNSPWTDLNSSMPSTTTHAKYDYIPSLPDKPRYANIKPDAIWPAKPPRIDLYCDADLLQHPLVSPLAARDWRGSPPVWFVVGEECLTDEGRGVAGIMVSQDVTVEWWEFQAMPHVFCAILPGTPVSRVCYEKWTQFMKRVTNINYEDASMKDKKLEPTDQPGTMTATRVEMPSLKERTLTLEEMSPFSVADIDQKLKEGHERRLKIEGWTPSPMVPPEGIPHEAVPAKL